MNISVLEIRVDQPICTVLAPANSKAFIDLATGQESPLDNGQYP